MLNRYDAPLLTRGADMRRREFLRVVGGAATLWPLAAVAQQKMPRIGELLVGGPQLIGPYREALRALGYVEGRTIQFETRSAQGQTSRLPELAAELVRSKIDVIVASLTPAVTAARRATSEIPIVMAPAGDPVGTGLISSLARPGGNITGMSSTGAELSAKNLELIREFAPGARLVGMAVNANDPFSLPLLRQMEEGARTTNFEVRHVVVRANDELEAAYATLAKSAVSAVILQTSLPVGQQVELALKHRLPMLANQLSAVQSGALIGYGSSLQERGREVARYVDRILKGAKPGDLPVQQPAAFELVVNLKTAKALGLTVPPTLLARADKVIE